MCASPIFSTQLNSKWRSDRPSVCSFVRSRLCRYLTLPWSEICSCLSDLICSLYLLFCFVSNINILPSFLTYWILRRQGKAIVILIVSRLYSALGDYTLTSSPALLGRKGSMTTLNTLPTFLPKITGSRKWTMSDKRQSSSGYSHLHQDTSALVLVFTTAMCSRVMKKDSLKACREEMFHF